MERWTFLTNHAHILLCIADDSGIRLRDVAERVGITERAAQRIVADQVPVIPLEYPEDWALSRDGLLGAGDAGLGIIRYAGLAWDD